jgi:O-antigen/teichoic acid export membrane protein
MENIIKIFLFLRRRNLRNLLILMSGTASAQILLLITTPILSRIYDPKSFGTLSIYTLGISVLSIMASFRLELLFIKEDDDKKIDNIIKLILVLNTIFSILLFVFIFVFNKNISNFLKIEHKEFLYFIPLGVWGLSLINISNYWLMREALFKEISNLKLNQTFFLVLYQILLGIFNFLSLGLIIGDAFSRITSGLIIFKRTYFNRIKKSLKINFREFIHVFKLYKGSTLYSMFSEMIYCFVNLSPPFFMAIFFGSANAGLYSFGLKIVNAPTVLIGKSFNQLYISEYKKIKNNKKEFLKLFRSTTKKIFLISFFPYLLLTLLGKDIFTLIFGSAWEKSGLFMQIMSLAFLSEIIVYPVKETLELIDKQKILLYWQVARAIMMFLSFLIPSLLGFEAIYSVFMLSIVTFFSYVILYLTIYIYLKGASDEN